MMEMIPMRDASRTRHPPPTTIEATISRPKDVNAPSFLTTLSGELRNRIYEIIYEKANPIVFSIYDYLKEDAGPYSIVCDSDSTECYNLSSVITLLLTCQQVYHEAVGILYGRNIFLFSSMRWGLHRDHDVIQKMADFLRDIGSQSSLIQKVELRLNWTFGDDRERMDLLPLIRWMWLNPTFEHRITVTSPYGDQDAANHLIRQLVTQETLEIKRYGRLERLVSSITIVDIDYGGVDFRSTSPHNRPQLVRYDDPKIFRFDDESQKLIWEPSTAKEIVEQVWSLTLQYLMESPSMIIFDIDHNTMSNFNPALLQVSNTPRCFIHENLARSTQVIVRMATEGLRSSFSQLERWMYQEMSRCLPSSPQEHPPVLLLEFQTKENAIALKDLRINIENFIGLTYELEGTVIVYVSLVSSFNGIEVRNETKLSLHDLRKKFLAMINICLRLHPGQKDSESFELWVNGNGVPVEVIFDAGVAGTEEHILITNTGSLESYAGKWTDDGHFFRQDFTNYWFSSKNPYGAKSMIAKQCSIEGLVKYSER